MMSLAGKIQPLTCGICCFRKKIVGIQLADGRTTELNNQQTSSFFFARYFSTQGWAGGPYPVIIPQSLRTALQDTSEAPSGGTRTTNWDSNARRETRSIFDLVAHLCGRPVPGIPLSSTLPSEPMDRVRQLHWMNATLLTFLRWRIVPFSWADVCGTVLLRWRMWYRFVGWRIVPFCGGDVSYRLV